MPRFLTSARRLGTLPKIDVRARKVRPGRVVGQLPDILPDAGLNIPETRVAHALAELRIAYQTQSSFMGGSILGGARADFVLTDYKIVLLVDGPHHRTSYGLGRDVLVDATYRASGFEVVHFSTDLINERFMQNLIDAIGVPVG